MWEQFGSLQLLIIFALAACFDAVTGLSNRLAVVIKRPRRSDVILLLLIVLCEIAKILWDNIYPIQIHGFIDYAATPEGHRALLADNARVKVIVAQMKAAAPYAKLIEVIEYVAAFVGLGLAKWQKRSLLLWIPLAFLCNVGAVIWLLVNRKQVRSTSDKII
jgi:hypothetical protein